MPDARSEAVLLKMTTSSSKEFHFDKMYIDRTKYLMTLDPLAKLFLCAYLTWSLVSFMRNYLQYCVSIQLLKPTNDCHMEDAQDGPNLFQVKIRAGF